MIGVLVSPTEKAAATEFFELCKTPWTFATPDTVDRHEVIITTDSACTRRTPGLVLHYLPSPAPKADAHVPVRATPPVDLPLHPDTEDSRPTQLLLHAGRTFPLYTGLKTFPDQPSDWLRLAPTGPSAVSFERHSAITVLRFGFALFAEVDHLLTAGQPAAHASTPTLDLHLALLRDALTRAGQRFVEIPPVPAPHRFAVCLTHDIDHPLQRNHCTDHAMLGFIYRATVGTALDVLRKKKPPGALLRNAVATAKLPLVALGWARDDWSHFDRYLEIEAGLGATYFVIPQPGNPGRRETGSAPRLRASRYEVAAILPQLQRLQAAGQEIGLHGLDAWLDADAARREVAALPPLADESTRGVRMHWLYFNRQSPAVLDRAGFSYDSTFGYNQTVGFRAGTAQAFRPPGTHRLWELPLHLMDTALFYPSYLNLTPTAAHHRIAPIATDVMNFGGALTVNWHDRSIAPERLWEPFYRELLADLKARGAWFARATDAVAWFRRRRATRFAVGEGGTLGVQVPASNPETASKRSPPAGFGGRRSVGAATEEGGCDGAQPSDRRPFSTRSEDETHRLPCMVVRVHPALPRAPTEPLSSAPHPTPRDVPLTLQPQQTLHLLS